MGQNDEAPGDGTPEAKRVFDDADDLINRQSHNTANGGAKQQQSKADCLFDEFGGADLLDAGLKAIARGWKIFPCDGKKKPLTPNGFKDATTDEATVRGWVKKWPGLLWARAVPEDIVVIDLDTKHGKNGIREFERLHGYSPDQFDAPRVRTGTGGNHLYTDATGRDFKNSADIIAKGVDTRTAGGYVIIPSGPDSGYCWLTNPDGSLPPTPQWAEVVLKKDENRTKSNGAGSENYDAWPEGFGSDELKKACEGIQNAGKGERDKACQDHAMWIGHLAGGGALDSIDALKELLDAARLNEGGGEEYVKKVRLAFDKALKEPIAAPPIRITAGVRTEVIDAVESALIHSNRGLFQRGGLLVRIDYWPMKTWDEKDIYIEAIVECGNDFLTETIANISKFAKSNERKKGWVRCDPPEWIASTLKQRKARLKLPGLNGVTNCPFMRANGEIVTAPGFHKDTGIYYDPRGVKFPEIPGVLTKEDARRALDRLKELFRTFPFVDNPSRSVALSMLLTTIARRALDSAPLHAFDSPTAGTGKSMLTDIVSIVATGEQAGVVALTEDQKEFDKHLSAILMRGVSLVAIDNCESPLKSTLLNQTLTQPITDCRILGKSESVQVRSNATISANGNNLIIEGDTTRRSICGRMDAGVERPELLKFDYSPLDDAREHRAELVTAGLTVLRAYHLAGRPVKETLGSFEQWSHLIRGALLWLDEADPAATMDELRKHDPKQTALKTVMLQWGFIWGVNKPISVSTMVQKANEWRKNDNGSGGFVAPEWRDALMIIAGVGSNISNHKVGRWLGKVKGRPMVFETETKKSTVKVEMSNAVNGRQLWAIRKMEAKAEQTPKFL